jgi:predicted acylesterase/phospholipase RssA/CRP-like cAMP-binding protein
MSEETIAVEKKLRRIPFFRSLPDESLSAIKDRMQLKHCRKGDIIVEEGDMADSMYLIESGQVEVILGSGEDERILANLGPGSFFGEMALLLGERRSATVRVTIDAELWALSKSEMGVLLKDYPSLGLAVSRELSRRLHDAIRKPVKRKQIRVITLSGTFASEQARALARQTGENVLWVPIGNAVPDLHPEMPGVTPFAPPPFLTTESLPEVLSRAVEDYPRVCLVIDSEETPLSRKAVDLADVVIQVGNVSVPWAKDIAGDRYWVTPFSSARLDSMARRIAGRQIGIALSSGNARGIAHIGVLRVLEDEGIPVDVLAGTSAGSLFGALYAAGKSLDEIVAFAHDLPRITGFRSGLWDFSIPPRSGIIEGKKTLRFIREFLGDRRFEDLKVPLYVVAADFHSGEEVVFHRGSVADAVRASISIIGLFRPMELDGRYLIDGGAVNPVPTSVLCDHGVETIIASSVIPDLEERLERQDMRRQGRLPGLSGIIIGALEIMESEIIKSRMGPVDILIKPKVADLHAMQYELADEFIRRGEEAARKRVGEIKALIALPPGR